MRLLIAGNLANTGYFLASKLRDQGILADLLMEKNPSLEADPLSTGELKNNQYPHWIKFWDKRTNWKKHVLVTMRKYDLISALTELPMLAFISHRPYIAIATGSDLRELAHSRSLKGNLLRLAYRHAKAVVFTDPDLIDSVKKLKLKNALYLPPIRDFHKIPQGKKSQKRIEKFIFFHPTNHIWDEKNNHLFLKAFVRLTELKNNVFLIIINRGEDSKKSIEFLKKSKIEGKYEILSSSLNQIEMSKYYELCNVVVDQFGVGSLGSIGLEAMYFKRPLISYIRDDIYKTFYKEKPPVLSCRREDEIFQILLKLVENNEFYQKVAIQSYEWINKFHSVDILVKKYILLIKSVHQGKKFEEIKKMMVFS